MQYRSITQGIAVVTELAVVDWTPSAFTHVCTYAGTLGVYREIIEICGQFCSVISYVWNNVDGQCGNVRPGGSKLIMQTNCAALIFIHRSWRAVLGTDVSGSCPIGERTGGEVRATRGTFDAWLHTQWSAYRISYSIRYNGIVHTI